MQTRMEKYTDVHEEVGQRFKKNEELYKKISDQELDKYTVKTNATVLDDNGTNIDVEHIKRILETKYNSTPKRKSIVIPEDNNEEVIDEIETKLYQEGANKVSFTIHDYKQLIDLYKNRKNP